MAPSYLRNLGEARRAAFDSARDRFAVNQTVRLTAKGRATFPKTPLTGIVRGFGASGQTVRVQPDGLSTVSSYFPDFWEPIPGATS